MCFRAFLALSLTVSGSTTCASEPAQTVQFNRDIRPILSDNCFLCHGPAKTTRKADLRLDTREGAFEDRGDDKVIMPGNPKASHLWLRVSEEDPTKRMPP